MERYRKRGEALRVERHGTRTFVLTSREEGEAEMDGLTFRCSSRDVTDELAHVAPAQSILDGIASLPSDVQHVVYTRGRAEHEIVDTDGTRRWSEENERVHAILHVRNRELFVDFDGTAALEQLHAFIDTVASTAAASRNDLLRFDDVAAAALISALSLFVPCSSLLRQHPRSAARDGRGHPVADTPLDAGWPNFFRPSYRARPVALPHDVALSATPTSASDDATIVLATSNIHIDGGELTFDALTSLGWLQRSVRLGELRSRLLEVSAPQRWFPLLAGAWGQRIALDCSR